ncbi:MAG: selenide, water dikinase SelD [Actinomycetota bacterium]
MLVSSAAMDDGAVVRLDDGTLLVQTVDVFGPPVDDPGDYGRIAAANAVSDVYAMGGEPRFALAVLAVPADLDRDVVARILRGGEELARSVGVTIVGGHTVTAPEPLYGLAVTGTVAPEDLWTNAGGRPGDLLCLTKPLGTGIVCNALRKDLAPADVIAAAVRSMATPNRDAARALRPHAPRAVVDVTGFGLVGHLHALARNSGCAAELDEAALPALPGVLDLLRAGAVPGGTRRNREAADYLDAGAADPELALLACDAQTSGGLLAAVAADADPAALPGPVVGRLVDGAPGAVHLA